MTIFDLGIKKNFNDGSKRINIDYNRIREYDKPFVMLLKVKGKDKLDVYEVANGNEAEKIRDRYKQENRYTSYVSFYQDIEDLKKENDESKLQFKPRIRGKNNKLSKELKEARTRKLKYERTIDGSLSLHIYNQQLAGTIKFVANLNNVTPTDMVTQILEEYLRNKFSDKNDR